ncbi:hypothetical protein AWC12_12030 [Mycolicibacterium iranicum]|uniref:Uncharacterized protein n=1 Tax=Mycolicibacterium iranicum TaxID=912594 RepID=A0A1X1WQ14_MYCIR|nr:hypothetical protein AWC12_12030 [Mycolicibacterium iranicum]
MRCGVFPRRKAVVVVFDSSGDYVRMQMGCLVAKHGDIDAFDVGHLAQHQGRLLKVRHERSQQVRICLVKVLDMLVKADDQTPGEASIVI